MNLIPNLSLKLITIAIGKYNLFQNNITIMHKILTRSKFSQMTLLLHDIFFPLSPMLRLKHLLMTATNVYINYCSCTYYLYAEQCQSEI